MDAQLGHTRSQDGDLTDLVHQFDRNGHATVENVVDVATQSALITALAGSNDDAAVRRRKSIYAIRNLLDIAPDVRTLSAHPAIRQWIDAILGPEAIAVRAILFDKTDDANWTVPWHQDIAIAVKERIDVADFQSWSVRQACLTFTHRRPY